jgi:hypothetical protein
MDLQVPVDFYLYPTEQSGRTTPIHGFFRPLSFLRGDPTLGVSGDLAHALILHVGGTPLVPGEKRHMTCGFTHQASFDAFMDAKKFYVRDLRIIGEITLVGLRNSN